MKKIMKIFVLVAAAAMALTSCQKNEIDSPVNDGVQFTINAGVAETKTIISDNEDGTYTPSWDGTENLAVLFALPDKDTDDSDAKKFANENGVGTTAKFSATVSGVSSTGTLYAVYPYEAFGRGFDGGIARLDLNHEQKPTATSFDPACDILVAKPYDYTVVENKVDVDPLYFTRVMTVLRVNLKSDFVDVQNENVESIKFEIDGVNITGYAKISVEDPTFTGEWTNKYNYVTATYESETISVNGTDNSVYFVVAPVTIPENNQLTFTIKTTNYTITKTVTEHPEMKFSAGNVAVINLNIKEDECTPLSTGTDTDKYYQKVTSEPSDWSGKYLLVVEDGVNRALSGISTTSTKYGLGIEVSIDDNKIIASDMSQYEIIIDKASITTGAYTMSLNSSLLYWTSGNSLSVNSTESAKTNWTISLDNGKLSIYNCSDSARQLLWNKTSPRFACYTGKETDGGYYYPHLYKFVDSNGGGSETPEPEQPKTLVSIAVAGQTTTYTVGDTFEFDGTVTATYDDESTATVTPTSVSEPDMTTVGPKEITVSYTEGEVTAETTYTITVNEAPAGPIVATIEEFLAAEDSETVWYQLTGTISSISNATFGNFDLTDETGTVYVYGLKKSKDAGNQTFSELGLKEGDTVTLIGNRDTYVNNDSEKDEVTNAYYVSHVAAPYLTVSSEAISVASTATSAEFTVDANVEWTVSCLTATATKSGNNVTVSFPANETAEAVVYEVVVNSQLGDEIVTITQAAASQGGGEEIVIFKESFGNNQDKARVWDDSYKEQSGIDAVYSASTYTMTNLKQGKYSTGHVNSGINQSSSATPAYFEVKNLNVQGYSNFKVSYYWKAGSIKGTYYTKLYYSTDGGNTYVEVEKDSGIGATSFVEVKYTLPSDIITSSLSLKVEFSTSNTQAVIDEFVLSATN